MIKDNYADDDLLMNCSAKARLNELRQIDPSEVGLSAGLQRIRLELVRIIQ